MFPRQIETLEHDIVEDNPLTSGTTLAKLRLRKYLLQELVRPLRQDDIVVLSTGHMRPTILTYLLFANRAARDDSKGRPPTFVGVLSIVRTPLSHVVIADSPDKALKSNERKPVILSIPAKK